MVDLAVRVGVPVPTATPIPAAQAERAGSLTTPTTKSRSMKLMKGRPVLNPSCHAVPVQVFSLELSVKWVGLSVSSFGVVYIIRKVAGPFWGWRDEE